MSNLASLYKIAQDNGGNRAFGLPGFDASVDFIKSKVSRYPLTSKSWIQDFPALFTKVESIEFRVDNTSYYVYGLTYSPSTPASGGTVRRLRLSRPRVKQARPSALPRWLQWTTSLLRPCSRPPNS